MKFNLFAIPAKQALAQKVKPIETGDIIGMNTNGTAVLLLEDQTLVCVPVDQLQGIEQSLEEQLAEITLVDDIPVEPPKTTGVTETPATTGVDKVKPASASKTKAPTGGTGSNKKSV